MSGQWKFSDVEKYGVMHVRRKGEKRTEEKFHVDGDEVKVLEKIQVPRVCGQ